MPKMIEFMNDETSPSSLPTQRPYLVKFAVSLGEHVRIKELDRPGVVDGLMLEDRGPQYRVTYWHDGERRATWLYLSEIELVQSGDSG